MTVADRIKLERQAQGLTQGELAKKMGYSSKSAVSRTENAGDNIGQKRIREFANALGVSESYLLGWTDRKTQAYIHIETEQPIKTHPSIEIAMKYYEAITKADEKTKDIINRLLEINQ